MKHLEIRIGLLAGLLLAGCANNAEEIGGARAAMGSGDGVSLQNATLSGATCIATPSKTVYESGEAIRIEVVILNAELPVAIPGWTNWTNDTTHTLSGNIRNNSDVTQTVSKTIATWDRNGSTTCSYSIQVLPIGVDAQSVGGGDAGLDSSL